MKSGFRRAVFILILLVVLAGLHLFVYTQNMSLKYNMTDLKIKLGELRRENRLLGSQIAQKENLSGIEKTAREKLEMTYPEEITYILISKEANR